MSRARHRQQTLKLLRAIRDGKHVIKPFENQTIVWNVDANGNFVYKEHSISPDKFTQFKEMMGGNHVFLFMDEASMPIGTSPDAIIAEREERTLGQKVKDLIHDIFSPEPKQVAKEAPKEKFLEPQPLQNIAGGGVGEWNMEESITVEGYEQFKNMRYGI